MEQPDHIDELLRRRLYDAELQPPAFVWPNIESALRKKKRRFFLWIFSGLGLVLTGLAGFWLLRDVPAEMTADQLQTEIQQSGSTVSSENSDISAQKETESIASSGTGNNVESQQNTATQEENTGAVVSKPGQNIFTAKGIKRNGRVYAPEVRPGTIPQEKPTVITAESQGTISDATVRSTAPAIGNGNLIEPANKVVSQLPHLSEPLQYARKTGNPQPVPIKRFKHKKKDPKSCYDFARHPTVWLVDAYAGPSFAFKELTTNDSEYKTYLNQRNETERRDWAFNAGLRATLLFDRHFMLRSGIHYEQMTEIFEYAEPNSIEIDITKRWDAMSGVWVDETTGVRYGEAYFKAYNRLGMLDIPLQAGMELRKGRTGFNVNAGVSFNVLFWKRGAILTTQSVPRYFSPNNVNAFDVFRPRTSLSAMASIQWFYHLQPRLRVFAEPYFRQIVQPVTVQGYPVSQRYGVGGIRLGLTKIID